MDNTAYGPDKHEMRFNGINNLRAHVGTARGGLGNLLVAAVVARCFELEITNNKTANDILTARQPVLVVGQSTTELINGTPIHNHK